MNWVKNNASLLVWLIALAGTWLSVYCREILHIEPCPLCWYQRMAVFPIAMILGINLYRGDKKLVVYLVPFVIFGLLAAVYQVFGGYFPFLLQAGLCGQGAPCSSSAITFFGFLTFPMLSGIGFASMGLLLFLGNKSS